MTMPQPGWYADPARLHDLRWWDGGRWTDAVVHEGVQTASPLPDARSAVQLSGPVQVSSPERVRDPVQRHADLVEHAASLFTEPVLVVDQEAERVELTDQYAVRDQAGRRIGSVVEVGQGARRRAVRLLGGVDRFLPHRVEVRDEQGVAQLLLVRRALTRSRVLVERTGTGEVGQLVQEVGGKVRVGLHSGGRQVGSLDAESRQGGDVRISDASGAEVARIHRTVEGVAKTPFTPADTSVVQIHQPLQEPLLSLVVASALTVDTALEPGVRGRG